MHGLREQHAAHRRARNQCRQATGEPPCVERMKAIDVFGRIDGRDDLLRVYLLRQRQLDEDTAHLFVRVEFRDECEQLRFARARR